MLISDKRFSQAGWSRSPELSTDAVEEVNPTNEVNDVQSTSNEEKKDPLSNGSLEKIHAVGTSSLQSFLIEAALLQHIASYLELSDINALMQVEKFCEETLNDNAFWKNLGENFTNLYNEKIDNKEDVKNYINFIRKNAKKCFGYDSRFLKIESQTPDFYSFCNELACLLNKTNFKNINDLESFSEMTNSLHLWHYLENNDLEEFENFIMQIDSFEKLQSCYDQAINWAASNLQDDEGIIYDYNSSKHKPLLKGIPIKIFEFLPKLKELRLRCKTIDSLPNNLEKLFPNLEILDLMGNQLTDEELIKITKLKNLKILNLAANELKNPPPEFCEFIKNRRINLDYNHIPRNFFCNENSYLNKTIYPENYLPIFFKLLGLIAFVTYAYGTILSKEKLYDICFCLFAFVITALMYHKTIGSREFEKGQF